jgi:hypothetical protein
VRPPTIYIYIYIYIIRSINVKVQEKQMKSPRKSRQEAAEKIEHTTKRIEM